MVEWVPRRVGVPPECPPTPSETALLECDATCVVFVFKIQLRGLLRPTSAGSSMLVPSCHVTYQTVTPTPRAGPGISPGRTRRADRKTKRLPCPPCSPRHPWASAPPRRAPRARPHPPSRSGNAAQGTPLSRSGNATLSSRQQALVQELEHHPAAEVWHVPLREVGSRAARQVLGSARHEHAAVRAVALLRRLAGLPHDLSPLRGVVRQPLLLGLVLVLKPAALAEAGRP